MQNKLFSKVFLWMFVGLALTFGVAYYLYSNPTMMNNLFSGSKVYIIFILELVTVIVFGVRIRKMSVMSARILFLFYSFLTGLTISAIFVLYPISSIIYVFLITSILFLIFGLIGYFTNIDLTKLGVILMMGLFGIIICSIINIFVKSETFDLVTTIVAVIIFLGYIAYDINIIKRNLIDMDEDKVAIYGALQLYMDFINLFIRLLSLFGKNKD